MNTSVYCLHCGSLQDWNASNWGCGPESLRVSFTCPGCGWFVQSEAKTWAFICSQIEIEEAGRA